MVKDPKERFLDTLYVFMCIIEVDIFLYMGSKIYSVSKKNLVRFFSSRFFPKHTHQRKEITVLSSVFFLYMLYMVQRSEGRVKYFSASRTVKEK